MGKHMIRFPFLKTHRVQCGKQIVHREKAEWMPGYWPQRGVWERDGHAERPAGCVLRVFQSLVIPGPKQEATTFHESTGTFCSEGDQCVCA